MYTAFSRDGPKKVYVQDLMKQHTKEISTLLDRSSGGYFYVCGDAANMAREVNILLGQIFAQERGVPEAKAESEVKAMRSSNRYQEDVWS
jgi:NADPH-ferrihemoprotein reductase